MTWTSDNPLTNDQLEYIRNFGGRIAVTSGRTGSTLEFSIVPTKTGTGLAVNHLSNPDNHYIGFIPKSNGNVSNRFVHTKGSTYTKENVVFRTFSWVWNNWGNLQGVTVKGC